MITLVIGEANCGKSVYAEDLLVKLSKGHNMYYIATMRVMDEDGARRIEKHRQQRANKGFFTIEEDTELIKAARQLKSDAFVLLECIANLTANLMFSGKESDETATEAKILKDVGILSDKCLELIIVSSRYPLEDEGYDEATEKYVATLDSVNRNLIEMADAVFECSNGSVKALKGGMR